MEKFIVILLEGGQYLLATRTAWDTREEAEKYAATCSPSRKPIVVECPRGVEFRPPIADKYPVPLS